MTHSSKVAIWLVLYCASMGSQTFRASSEECELTRWGLNSIMENLAGLPVRLAVAPGIDREPGRVNPGIGHRTWD